MRRIERMQEGVQVAAGQVMFLIPVGGRQDNVSIVGRRIHAQVEIYHQIQLAGINLVMPLYFLHHLLGAFSTEHIVMRSEQISLAILLTTRAGAEEVATPDGEYFGMVILVINVSQSEVHLAVFELSRNPRGDFRIGFATICNSFFVHIKWIFLVKLREEREPAAAHCQVIQVGGVLTMLRQ